MNNFYPAFISTTKKYFKVLLLTFMVGSGLNGWGQTTLPISRTAWGGAAPVGWTQNAVTQRTSTFACSGSDGGSLQSSGSYYRVFFNSTPNQLTYNLKGSNTSTGSYKVQESDNGTAWTDVSSFTTITGTTCQAQSFTLLSTTRYVQFIYITKTTGNVDIDDVSITGLSCTPPTNQASALSFSSITPTSQTLNFTRGNGTAGVLAIARAGSAPTDPTSGTGYAANATFGSGNAVGSGFAVYNGTGTTETITGLAAQTQYFYNFYEYNTTGTCYNTTELAGSAWTLSAEPAADAAPFTCNSLAFNEINLNFSAASTITNADGYIVLQRVGAVPTGVPLDGTGYTVGSTIGDATVAAIINSTTINNQTITGLTANTSYYYTLIPFNWNGTSTATYNYRTASIPSTNCTTPLAPSLTSDIINDATYGLTSNFDYKLWQTASPQTSTADGLGMFNIIIRDGGGAADADVLPTILNAITFNCPNFSNIRSAALFTTTGSPLASVAVSAANISFTGLSVTAPDDGNVELILRLSFNNTAATITDNSKIVFTVTIATAASSTTSSQFATVNAGGAVSDNDGDNENRLEVTATKLNISAIANGFVNTNLSSFTVTAADVNNVTDFDRTENVALATTGTGITSTSPYALVNGVVSISNVQYNAAQTAINITVTVSAPSLTGTSNNFDVNIVTASVDDYRTNPALGSTGSISFSSTTAIGGVRPWQTWNGSAWVDVTGTSAASSPESVATVPPNIYVISGAFVDIAGGRTYNNITIDLPSASGIVYSGNTTVGLGIATGKILDIKTGILDLAGRLDLQGTSQMIVRTGAEIDISSSSANFIRSAGSTWEVENGGFVFVNNYIGDSWTGIEKFDDESFFTFTDWNPANSLFTAGSISATTVGSYSALFGYLTIDIPNGGLTTNWTGILPASTNVNLTHKDFEIINNETDNLSLYSGNTSTVVVGGNLLVGGTGNVQFQTGAGSLTFTTKGNFVKNGSGDFRLHTFGSATVGNDVIFNVDGNFTANAGFFVLSTASASGTSETVNLKGNLKKLLAGYMTQANTSGFANSSFNFIGTSIQTVDVVLQNSNDMLRYRFFVKNGANVQTITQDWRFADQGRLTVELGGTMDFGFNGSTALNLVETVSSATTFFALQNGGTIKITSAEMNGAIRAANLSGNVQLDTRSYGLTGIYHYIGKVNQYTGDGLPTTGSAKTIICDLLDNTKELTFTNSAAITTPGNLDIRVGRVIETTAALITGSTGLLNMATGTYYKIVKGNATAAASAGDLIPRISGTYSLVGGTIELDNAASTDAFQTLRGGRTYYNVTFSGANTLGTDYKNLSSNTTVNNTLAVNGTAIVDCSDGGTNARSFTGNAGITMSGGRIRFLNRSSSQPELTGTATAYALTGGVMEFYANAPGGLQTIKGLDANSNPIEYSAIEVTGSAVGNGNANITLRNNGSFTVKPTGIFEINDDAIVGPTGTQTVTVETGGVFKTGDIHGFAGAGSTVSTSIKNDIENVVLQPGSTVEYSKATGVAQIITSAGVTSPASANYYNLTLSGTGNKTAPNTTLTLLGNLTKTGTCVFVNNGGKVSFEGSTPATISSTAPMLSFWNIDLANTGGVDLANDVAVENIFSPKANSIFNLGANNVHLKSNATNTAQVDVLPSSAVFNYAGSTGFIVERYIQQGRKWRLLAVPATTTQTIRQSWMEGAVNIASNPNPGFGTIVTDDRTTALAQGFDAQSLSGPSMKIYNAAGGNFTPLTSPSDLLNVSSAYYTFVRGDRTALPSNATVNSTTLRTTGQLKRDAQNVVGIPSGEFRAVGNPYASRIDLRTIFSNSTISPNVYVWDPLLTGSLGFGGYQTLTRTGTDFIIVPGGGSYGAAGTAMNSIESGQGFLVRAGASAANLNINETDKATGSAVVNRTTASRESFINNLYIQLQKQNSNTDTIFTLVDGVATIFDDAETADVDFNDAKKLINTNENISIKVTDKTLSVERRPMYNNNDTLQLNMANVRVGNYAWQVLLNDFNVQNVDLFLGDRMLQTEKQVTAAENKIIFNISASNAASYANNRFYVVFKTKKPAEAPQEPTVISGEFDFTIAQNPISNNSNTVRLLLSNVTNNTDLNVQLFNAVGKQIMVKNIQIAYNIIEVPLAQNLAAGMYFVKITTPDAKLITKKLIVQ
jgi:hypothetical protein